MTQNKYHFEKLTPVDNIDLTVYEDALNYIFDNPDVKNVAISGGYSAGKSSILESYKKKHSNIQFLSISLAHFTPPEQEKSEIKESVLEGKILNQLIHQIPSKKIPQTNFRVKKKISPKSVIRKTIETIFLLITIIYFTCFNSWKNYVNTLPDNWFKTILILSTHPYALMVDGILMLSILSLITYKLIDIQKNKNIFRKLNLQGNEIEIFNENEDSYFDKYLNEVLYLFENADTDIIIFEDMDRFNTNGIFERLREVNTLVNIHLQLKKNKKVLRFFYLLRDDIFTSKDRIKFFDYIIPVIPVVNSSNSYDQLISLFKKSELYERFNESFLQGLSLYIDDMRLLKNIYNEFIIYYNKLNTIELNCNKMLAIIAYKNIFPCDFANLQLNQGFVYTIFNSKDIFIEEKLNGIKEQISKKQEEIELIKKEYLESEHEINVIFAYKHLNTYSWYKYSKDKLDNFVSEHLFDNNANEYYKRKKLLEDYSNRSISQIEEELQDLNHELKLIKNQKLHEIINRDNINKIFNITFTNEIGKVSNFYEVKSSEYFDLLKYLIRNGYIDETYTDYMTYFYENSLSRIDKNFLRSITDKSAKEYTYQLKNAKLVVSRLRLEDFQQEEILNFDLLTYLLHTPSYAKYVERFIKQLKDTRNFKFISEFFNITTELPFFIKYLNITWSEMFLTALNNQALTEKQIYKYSLYTIYYSDDTIIQLINKNNCLSDYISNTQDYLAIDNPNIDKLIHCFTLLHVSFIGFNYSRLNKNLFHAVYQESLYKINAENLQLIQKEILGIYNIEDILHKNYTLLCSYPDSAITQYINQNINSYFDIILQISDRVIYDDENIAIIVLNNSDLTIEHKHSYISALQTTITRIKDITDYSLWSMLLETDKVQYSEYNIIDYFNTIKLNESLISYINRGDTELDFSKIECDNECKQTLFNNLIECNSLDNLKYKQTLVSLNCYCTNFNPVGLSDYKFIILIEANIIRMTVDNLKFIRKTYPNLKFYFIFKNVEAYVDIMTPSLFLLKELLEILHLKFNDQLKIKLLEFSNDEISIIGKKYSPTICLHILNHNFMKSDLIELFSSFEEWDRSIQTKIFDLAKNNMVSIIDNANCISKHLKRELLSSDSLDRAIKIDFLIAMIPSLDDNCLKEFLILLNLTLYLKIFNTRKRPIFKINNENKKLLTAFKQRNLIDSYVESSKKPGYFKITHIKSIKE